MKSKVTTKDVEELIETSNRQIREESATFRRYLMEEVEWGDRLICIKGARGTGKTTMMRQRMKSEFGEDSRKALYVSLDDLWFARFDVKGLVRYLYERGWTHVFMDEVHHLGKTWSLTIKNIADQFRNMNIVYSGSSLLQLEKARGDLSRRQSVYTLRGMSFREYLHLEGQGDFPVLRLEEILKNHVEIAESINRKSKVLSCFEEYQKRGYYPFYRESRAKFRERLMDTVNKVLELDYPSIDEVSRETIIKTRKMLMVLASSCPQTPNMSELYRELGTARDQGLKMLNALERAGLLALLDAKGVKLGDLSKPEKIYCDNTSVMHALVPNVDEGVSRETYFYNQVRKDHSVAYTGIGDFVVDGKWTFDVGGRGNGFAQIADIQRSFVVNDDVAVGTGNKIPLWLFGFLY